MDGEPDHPRDSSPSPQLLQPSSSSLSNEASPSKPQFFRGTVSGTGGKSVPVTTGNVSASPPAEPSDSPAPQELTLSYLCDNLKSGPPASQEKEGLSNDLIASIEKSLLKGKEIVLEPSNDDGRRWVERDFLQLAGGKPSAKREAPEETGDGDVREKKVKTETLSLSLGPPNLTLSLNPSIPTSDAAAAMASTPNNPAAVVPPKKSYSNSLRAANSEDYAPSFSYTCSVPFSHNPSCSLTRNSTEYYEFSRGDNDKIWYAGEGTNGSVHSKFKPVGDGNTVSFANISKEFNNSLYKVNSSDNVAFLPYEFPGIAKHTKVNSVASSDSGRNGMRTKPERILREIVSESVPTIAHEFSNESLEALRECLRNIIEAPEKKDEFASLQRKLERRSDLTFEVLSKAYRPQLEILVAVKTGIVAYVSGEIRIPSNELAEIFLLLRCRNMSCKNALPVDDCDCNICSTQKGFCSACMCPICLKFDCALNTCSWVGCDACSHWCHAACGIEKNLIRPGPSAKGRIGTEMQFQCLGCGQNSKMFGFVKAVFNECAKNWQPDTLVKELDCVRKIFRASEDFEGKGLHSKAEEVLNMLAKKVISAKEACASMLQFFKYGVTEFSVTGSSSKNILAQASEHADVPLPSAATVNVRKTTNFSPATTMLDKQLDALKAGAKAHALEAHFNYSKDDGFKSLETIVKCKEAEANLFQRLADDARREVEGYRQIVHAKSEKLEEYAAKIAKLALHEAEEKHRKKLEELNFLENSHCDYQNMKMRMQAEIAALLERMEATKKMWA